MKLPTVTMIGRFEDVTDPTANTAALNELLGGAPWYAAAPGIPACGTVTYIGADKTRDGTERMYVCDRPAGHTPADQHRQVIDADEGQSLEWRDGTADQL